MNSEYNTQSVKPDPTARRIRRHLKLRRILILAALLIPPVAVIVSSGAIAETSTNPLADYWRLVREAKPGYTAVSGQETGVLIQVSGETWRRLRNGPVALLGAWLQALTVFALLAFFMIRGRVRLTQPRSGIRIHRWNMAERVVHWVTAILFLVLAVTGLSLLYGRALLIPLVGHESFSVYADLAKQFHNICGLFFIAGLITMIIFWARDNLPDRYDLDWFKAFGGMIGNRHPSAARMNGGEKAWFWLLALAGSGVALTGLILDFPIFGLERPLMQLGHLLHLGLAILLIVGALGHIYIGTIGTEGAFEGMISGEVDTSWAIQHHDIWYQEVSGNTAATGETIPPPAQPGLHSDPNSDPDL